MTAGTRRVYGSYWNQVTEHWGDRHLDEPTSSEIRQLMTRVRTHAVSRRAAVRHLVLCGTNLVRIPPGTGAMTSLEAFEPYASRRLHW